MATVNNMRQEGDVLPVMVSNWTRIGKQRCGMSGLGISTAKDEDKMFKSHTPSLDTLNLNVPKYYYS